MQRVADRLVSPKGLQEDAKLVTEFPESEALSLNAEATRPVLAYSAALAWETPVLLDGGEDVSLPES